MLVQSVNVVLDLCETLITLHGWRDLIQAGITPTLTLSERRAAEKVTICRALLREMSFGQMHLQCNFLPAKSDTTANSAQLFLTRSPDR